VPFDRQDYEEHLETVKRDLLQSRRHELERLAQAPVAMAALTGDPNWDVFLQILQADLEKVRIALEALKERMVDSIDVNPETLVLERIQAKVYQSQILTLEKVIGLPKQIKEEGVEAQKDLDELGTA
jgi:hypothetical protein